MKLKSLPQLVKGYVDAVPTPKQRLPRVIQFPINDICNSRCQMCHIWKQKLTDQLTPDQIRTILANPLFREVGSVGINGGEPTLRKDLPDVVRAVVETLPQIASINLITNCIIHKRVNAAIDELADICNANGVHLDVMASLDGIGEVHDRVRGIKGNFESVVKVLDHLATHEGVGSSRIGCTVIKENVYGVEDVLAWCQDRSIYARFRIGIPHQRLYGKEIDEPFALTWDERFHFAAFLDHLYLHYERNENRRMFYRSLRDQVIYNKPRMAGCAWKSRGVTLTYDGSLAYCAVESKELGSLLTEDAEALYWSNADHLEEIVSTKCATCLHDYDGISDRKAYLKNLGKRALQKMPPVVEDTVRQSSRNGRMKQEDKRLQSVREQKITPGTLLLPEASNRVLICGWYGTETLGDKAIIGGVVDGLRTADPDLVFDLAAIEPYVCQQTVRQMPELEISEIYTLAQAKERIRNGHYGIVMMGGGPLMAAVGECIDMLEMLTLGQQAGAHTVVAGCGVGPLGHPTRNAIIAEILSVADTVMLRDAKSIDVAQRELGFKGRATRILDPAFFWIHNQLEKQTLSQPTGTPPQVLMALRDWPIHEYGAAMKQKEAEHMKARFEQEIREFADALGQQAPDTNIVPFCMHKLAVGGDDRVFYRRLFKHKPAVLGHLDNRHRPPAQDLHTFQSAQAVLAMRFHSVVFSLATGRPFLAIDYTLGGKIAGLLGDLGLSDRLINLADFKGAAAADQLLRVPPAETDLQARIEASKAIFIQEMSAVLA